MKTFVLAEELQKLISTKKCVARVQCYKLFLLRKLRFSIIWRKSNHSLSFESNGVAFGARSSSQNSIVNLFEIA
jgi:hypothetical protein